MSNKGGVGKSTCTTNLAVSLALKGWHVGICDMDIHGPNIPKMVGAEGQKLKISTSGGIIPFQAYNLKIASMSFLLAESRTIRSSGAMPTSMSSSINCWAGSSGRISISCLSTSARNRQRIGDDHRSARQCQRRGDRHDAAGSGLVGFPQVGHVLQRQRSADHRDCRKHERVRVPPLSQPYRSVPQGRRGSLRAWIWACPSSGGFRSIPMW